jgi:hypothetical protein
MIPVWGVVLTVVPALILFYFVIGSNGSGYDLKQLICHVCGHTIRRHGIGKCRFDGNVYQKSVSLFPQEIHNDCDQQSFFKYS